METEGRPLEPDAVPDAVPGGLPDGLPGGLPDGLGGPAARALAGANVTDLEEVARHSVRELLALHGVGPTAISTLGDALAARGLAFRET